MCRDMPVILPVCMCLDMLKAPICVVTYSLLSSMCLVTCLVYRLFACVVHPPSLSCPLSIQQIYLCIPPTPSQPPSHKSALSLSLSICSKSFSCHTILCLNVKIKINVIQSLTVNTPTSTFSSLHNLIFIITSFSSLLLPKPPTTPPGHL